MPSMEQRLLAPLNALEASLNTLVHSLTSSATFTAAPKAARDLVAADDDLTEALIILKRHQDNYQEILRLRAEKEALNSKIKKTIFECVRLKKELRDIDSRIVDESDDEDEETARNHKPVDYETLLAFASRIGKHNAIAAQEAEKESERQYLEAKKKRDEAKSQTQPTTNGSHAEEKTVSFGTDAKPDDTSHSVPTQEAQAKMELLRNQRLWDRSQITAPFPNAEILRMGALGKLQLIREQDGEEAVEAYVEKLVRETELKESGSDVDVEAQADLERRESAAAAARRTSADRTQQQARSQQQQPQQPRPKPVINLDFPEEEDEDGDDDG